MGAVMDARSTQNVETRREVRNREVNRKVAETLHLLAFCIEELAKGMDDEDPILGAIAGHGIANHCASLPKHVRDVFMEHLSDEAHAGYLADQRYFDADASRVPSGTRNQTAGEHCDG